MLAWRASASRNAARRAKAAGDWRLAAQHYRRAVERDPHNAATWVQYGNALRECGSTAEAEIAYRKSLELADNDPDAHVQLGHLLKHQRRGDEAIVEYLRALSLDPWLLHATQELIGLGWTSHVKPPPAAAGRRLETVLAGETRPAPAVVIDAGDLLLHFLHARSPTGIQRVQLHIVASLLAGPATDYELLLACFAPHPDFWVRVPEDLFATLAALAMSGSATDERAWQEAVLELTSILVHGAPIEFPIGAALVNLGACWPHLNYLLKLRSAKSRYGIRFIPFVHDCVPVLMPELCVETTVRNYIDWLLSVFFHADGYLVNSKSTATDLAKVASLLGHRILPPQVIPLDGRFQTVDEAGGAKGPERRRPVRRHGPAKPFVLFVSTFEPRKNHMLAFTVWRKLIDKRGLRRTPTLVCVGHHGWNTEAAMSLLRSSKALQRRVRILTGIADVDLAELYQRCLFTLYPSLYEGWGLPVTESLCYGKVPLIAAISSLPEAGGDFAEYFDLESPVDLIGKLERLIDNENYRLKREASIKAKFRPRSWSAIARQVMDYALTRQGTATSWAFRGTPGEVSGVWAPPAEMGRYYAIARGRETSIRPGMIAGEMFRVGEAWWIPEDWGCWLKEAHADIAFSLPEAGDRPFLLYLGLRGLPMNPAEFQLSIGTNRPVRTGILQPDQYQWPMLRVEPDAKSGSIRLRLTSNGSCDLAVVSRGTDRRLVTLGVIGLYLCPVDGSGSLPDFVRNNAKPPSSPHASA